VECKKSRLYVKCGEGCIALQTLKPEGAKLLTSADMINGRKVKAGDVFGD
jgi:methionyl-tRNA formyltransferase